MGADGLTNTSSRACTPGHALTHRQTPCVLPGPWQPPGELRATRRAAAPCSCLPCRKQAVGRCCQERQVLSCKELSTTRKKMLGVSRGSKLSSPAALPVVHGQQQQSWGRPAAHPPL